MIKICIVFWCPVNFLKCALNGSDWQQYSSTFRWRVLANLSARMNSGLSCYIKAANPTMETLFPDAKSGLCSPVHISLGSTFMLFWTIKTPVSGVKAWLTAITGGSMHQRKCAETEWQQGWSVNNLIDCSARKFICVYVHNLRSEWWKK